MPKLPRIEELCLSTSLYVKFDFDASDKDQLRRMITNNITMDAHCIECGEKSTFVFRGRAAAVQVSPNQPGWQTGALKLSLRVCGTMITS